MNCKAFVETIIMYNRKFVTANHCHYLHITYLRIVWVVLEMGSPVFFG